MRRAAITGIAGQDGTCLARMLLREGYEVHGLLRADFRREEPKLRQRFTDTEMAAIRWHRGNMEDEFSVLRFLKKAEPDEIYHLAGLSDSRESFEMPAQAVRSIVLGTVTVLEGSLDICPTARIFLASSAEVFGQPACTPQDEDTLMRPETPYGIAHLAADQFARMHRERHGRFIAIGLSYNHESPLRPPNYLSARVARAVAAIHRGEQKELTLMGLDSERDWGDARDFVKAFHLALRATTPDDYVLATGYVRPVADLVETAFAAAGMDYRKHVQVVRHWADTGTQVKFGLRGNAGRAANGLGWKRDWSFQQTITDMVRTELRGEKSPIAFLPDVTER